MIRIQLAAAVPAFTTLASGMGRSSETLVTDINTSHPPFSSGSLPSDLAAAHGRAFFTAWIEVVDREPFVTDGTAAGTHLIQDIFPGLSSSSKSMRFVEVPGGGVLFMANDGPNGLELWTCDALGTTASMVADVRPGPLGSMGGPLTPYGGKFYFFADDGVHGRELWVTQGTAATTMLFHEFIPGSEGLVSQANPVMCEADGILYVVASDGTPSNTALWRTDGTAAGTQVVVSGPSFFTGWVEEMAAHQGNLYFSAFHPTLGTELWRSDGTAAGTYVVRDIDPQGSASPGGLTVVGDHLLFAAAHPGTKRELFRTDGTFAGTTLVLDIASGVPNLASVPEPLGVIGGRLVFTATTEAEGRELWVTDGTTAGTTLLADIRAGAEGSEPNEAVVLGSTLFFGADDGTSGRELWTTDGTVAGTAMVVDIRPGAEGSVPQQPTPLGDRIVFRADDGLHGDELWTSDGTAAGTRLVVDLLPGPETSHSLPLDLTRAGANLFLTAEEPTEGRELYVVDGPGADAVRISSIGPGPEGANMLGFAGLGERLIFFADDGVHGLEPWVSDGTAAGTNALKDLYPGPNDSTLVNSPRAVFDGRVFFYGAEPSRFGGLYATNGTSAGTIRVSDVRPAQDSGAMAVAGGRLFFAGGVSSTGTELCVSDGTTLGTYVLMDIRPGIDSGVLDPRLHPVGDRVFFLAYDGVHGNELWVSDGTVSGTSMVVDFVPGSDGLTAVGVAALGDDAVAIVNSNSTSTVLRTDGTAAGTTILVTFPSSTTVAGDVVAAGGEVFFHVVMPSFTRVWHTDGTVAGTGPVAAGTAILADPVVIGVPGSGIRVAAKATVPDKGAELVAFGGDLPQFVFADVFVGPKGSNPASIVRVGSRVYFTADDGVHGFELHAIPLSFFADAAAETYGEGCAPSGPAPELAVTSPPTSGGTFAFEATGFAPDGLALLVLGVGPAYEPLPGGCTFLVASPHVAFPIATNASGTVLFGAPVPPGLADLAAYLQIFDTDASGALLATPGLEIVVGA